MEFKCTCGHLVADETDGIPNKAKLVPDIEFETYSDKADAAIVDFITSIMDGRREEWMSRHFTEGYPTDLSNAEMLGDILDWIYLGQTKEVYQCDNCGRIWIEKDGVNMSFMPEGEGSKGILN